MAIQPDRVYGSYKRLKAEREAREERQRKAKENPQRDTEATLAAAMLLASNYQYERDLKIEERRRQNGGW